ISCDFVLLSRIHALFHSHKTVQTLVYVCYVLEIAGLCIGLALTLPGIKFDEKCTVLGVPPNLLIYAGACVAFQTVLYALMLYQFLRGLKTSWGNIPIIKLLMRDGTWGFFLLFVSVTAYSSLYGLKNSAYAGVLYSWSLTAYSFCGYRILLNINHFTRTPRSINIVTLSSLHFVQSSSQ
ncbi:hypothetical protein L218DRAFT_871312, partial [Marasmius fiardii PR-910]